MVSGVLWFISAWLESISIMFGIISEGIEILYMKLDKALLQFCRWTESVNKGKNGNDEE